MKSGKSRRARPWGRIESLEPREMMTLAPTLLGNFELCQAGSTEVDFRGESSHYLAAEATGEGCDLRSNYDSLVRTNGTPEGTVVVGTNLGEMVLLDSFFVANDNIYFEVLTSGYGARAFFVTDGSEGNTRQLSNALGEYPAEDPVEFDGNVYFTSDYGREIWRFDGTDLSSIQEISRNQIDQLRPVGDQLTFSTLNAHSVWMSDGTKEGTQSIFRSDISWMDVDRLYPAYWLPATESYLLAAFDTMEIEDGAKQVSLSYSLVNGRNREVSERTLEFHSEAYSFWPEDDPSQSIFSVFDEHADSNHITVTDWYTNWTDEGTYAIQTTRRSPEHARPTTQGSWRGDAIYAHFEELDSEVIMELTARGHRELIRTNDAILSINVLPNDQAMLVETGPRTGTTLWIIDETGTSELANYRSHPDVTLEPTEWNGVSVFHAGNVLWQTDGTAEGTIAVDEASEIIHFAEHAVYYRKHEEIWRASSGRLKPEKVDDSELELFIGTDDFLIFDDNEQFVVNKYLSSPVSAEEYLGVEVGEVVLELSNGNALIFEKQNETGLTEYWHTDGTPAGTYPIGILSPRREYQEWNQFCGFPERFTEAGDYVLYTVDTCVEYQTWSMHLYPEPVKPVLADVRRELDVGEANDVALADFDNDGDLDAYFIRDAADEIWWNDGAGFYEDSGIRFETEGTNDVELVDVDLDGDVDIVVAAVGGNRIFLRDGEDSYREIPLEREEGVVSVDVSAGDVNGDERPDFYFANQSESGGVAEDNLVLSRDALWQTTTGYGVQTSYASAFADFDEDGDLDLVVSNDAERGGYFYENRGPAGARLQRQGEVWAAPGVVDAFRLHSNPTPDEYPGNIGLVGLGAGPGTVYPTSSRCCNRTWGHQLGDLPQNDFAIGDFDSDGDNDLFFAAAGDHGNSLWLNSNGQFQFWQSNLDTGVATRAVAAGDVDGDGDTDVIAVTEDGRSRIYLNLSADTFGDLDLDGGLTDRDVATLRSNFATSDAIYADGDLNNDQLVTFEDYLLLSEQFANRSVEQDGHFREV